MAGQLRQRLPAEAGAAGAEDDDVGGAVGQPRGRLADRRQIVMRAPAAAAAAGRRRHGARASLRARLRRASSAVVERLVGNAVLPDVLFERAVDGLDDGHGNTSPLSSPAHAGDPAIRHIQVAMASQVRR